MTLRIQSFVLGLTFTFFCLLGIWQIYRGMDKTHQAQQIKAWQNHPIMIDHQSPENLPQHRRVHLSGQWLNPNTQYVDQSRSGHLITQVLTPFITTDGPIFWVQRGSMTAHHPAPELPQENTTITVDITHPKPPIQGLTEPTSPKHWKASYLDLSTLSQHLKKPISHTSLLTLISPTETALHATPPVHLPSPWRHYGYAIQFFFVAIFIGFRYQSSYASRQTQSS